MVPFIALHLNRRSKVPLQRQLYDEMRIAILSGRLPPGARVPATRVLAADSGISRNTVSGAFDQLMAEGYLEGKTGSGTYVARTLPEDLLRVTRQPDSRELVSSFKNTFTGRPACSLPLAVLCRTGDRDRRGADWPTVAAGSLSRRGKRLGAIPVTTRFRASATVQAFRPGLPALDEFPRDIWARLTARILRHVPAEVLTYGDPAGYLPLRRAISDYLRAARGVNCSAEQVIVTAGSQQALDLAARLLLDPGDTAWVEDPGYLGARSALRAAGVRCVAVPVDAEGLSVAEGEARAPQARLACVTPSHQYPLGVTMPLSRRTALLAWARRRRAWIVEDDYDSEFRYSGRPLPALQGLDPADRVIYTGTFSKVLFPSLRLGYMVVPEPLVDAFVSARALADRQPPGIEQSVAAEFLAEGHFARHLRRMRSFYAERQEALVAAVHKQLAEQLRVAPAEAGMQLIAWLPKNTSDAEVSRRAAEAGIVATPISSYAVEAKLQPGLLLGYAGFSARVIREAVRKLAGIL